MCQVAIAPSGACGFGAVGESFGLCGEVLVVRRALGCSQGLAFAGR
jgi:hypothetical protein